MTGRNPWAVLGVAEDAPYEEIQRAYRRKVKQTHPDRGGAAGDFRAVANAVKELRRLGPPRPVATLPSQYDRWLRPGRPKGSRADHGRPSDRASWGPAVASGTPTTQFVGRNFGALLEREMAEMTKAITASGLQPGTAACSAA
jgi:curved DNA-binding protein CbpA